MAFSLLAAVLLLLSALLAQAAHAKPVLEQTYGAPDTMRKLSAMAADKQGRLYVLDAATPGTPRRPRVLVYDANGGLLNTWWASDKATGEEIPGIGVGPDGKVWVTYFPASVPDEIYSPDGELLRHWHPEHDVVGDVKFDSEGNFLGAWGAPEGLEFSDPWLMEVDADGSVYVADRVGILAGKGHRIYRFDSDGNFLGFLVGPGNPAELAGPAKAAADAEGNVWVADTPNNQIKKFSPDGRLLAVWGPGSANPVPLDEPWGINVDNHGRIWVGAPGNSNYFGSSSMKVLNPDGSVLTERGYFYYPEDRGAPSDIEIDHANGVAYTLDSETGVIESFHTATAGFRSTVRTRHGTQGNTAVVHPRDMSLGPDGNLYIADTGHNQVVVANQQDQDIRRWGSEGDGDGEFQRPEGIAVDAQGRVFVADTYANRIQIFDSEGNFLRRWVLYGDETVRFNLPSGLHLDRYGRLYIANRGSGVVHRVRFEPPETRIDSAPDELTNDARPTFSFSASWESRFECSLVPAGQEPEFRPCSDPQGTHTPDEPLADGEYVFSVRAVDEYADRDPSPAEVSFTVEATAPKTTITRGPRELGNDPNPVFEFEADKPGVSFECRLDDGEWEPCSSPKDYEMLADGEHVFSVRATGALGNVEADPPQYAFTIDTVPPRTEITDGPRELGNDPNPVFEFEADKEGAEFECRLDDGEWEPCSSPVSYEGLDDGEHTFSVRAVGPTGKAEAEPQSHTFVIDTVAPQIEIDEPTEGAALTSKRATIAFTVNEEAQVSCRLAGEGRSDGFEPCSSPAAYEDLADGAYTFEVRAVDAAGNVGTASRAFRVVANACQRAEAEVSAAQKQLTKAQRAVKQAKSKLKALKRRRAPAAKVRRAKAKVKQANKALAAAKKRLANARGARVQACGA